jgi:hypothetical protein
MMVQRVETKLDAQADRFGLARVTRTPYLPAR